MQANKKPQTNTLLRKKPTTFPLIAGIRKTSAPSVRFNESALSTPLFIVERAGFQQCMAQLTSYMQKIPGPQRIHFDRLHPPVRQQPNTIQPDSSRRQVEGEVESRLVSAYASERDEDSLQPPSSSHSPFQPVSCSTPSHENAFAPPSPWLSPTFSTFVSTPSFLSSALSADTSFFSISPTTYHLGFPVPGCPTAAMPHLTPREQSPPNSSLPFWRPWF